MSVKTFTFCDICNHNCIVSPDRRDKSREGASGRRSTDHCSWIEGRPDDSTEYGWITTSKGKHVCPQCYLEHKEAVFTL